MKNQITIITMLLFACVITKNTYAQDSNPAFPKLAIGLSPSSFINVYFGPQASLDIRINNKLNSANEFTYVLGIFDTPGFRVKSGLQFLLKDYRSGCLTLGPNLIYQRVKTDIFYNHSLTFSDRANHLDIDFIQNRIALDALGSVRFDLTKKLYIEFGLGAGMHYTTDKVTGATADNLKQLLKEEPEFTFEEGRKETRFGLLTSYNVNFSVVIEE